MSRSTPVIADGTGLLMDSCIGFDGGAGYDPDSQAYQELGSGGDADHGRYVRPRKMMPDDVGESSFRQDEYEDALQRLDDLGVKLSVM